MHFPIRCSVPWTPVVVPTVPGALPVSTYECADCRATVRHPTGPPVTRRFPGRLWASGPASPRHDYT